jgi:hypothetical protein
VSKAASVGGLCFRALAKRAVEFAGAFFRWPLLPSGTPRWAATAGPTNAGLNVNRFTLAPALWLDNASAAED